jgi:mannose-6-phosphate isomerase-like protein (cupin superfamily)
MKKALCFIAAVAAAAALAGIALFGADGPQPATYVDHEKVATAFVKGGALAKGDDFTASVAQRTAPGQVEVHEKETDIFYITEGEATFLTGGKMIGGKLARAAQWLGTDIEGGVTHHLTKGDIITIPAGTPHWFKEVKGSITYYMVKVIRP